MKLTLLLVALSVSLFAADEPKPDPSKVIDPDKRFAAEHARSLYYKLSNDAQNLQRELFKAQEGYNKLAKEFKDACDAAGGVYDQEMISCGPKPPAGPPQEQK